MLLLLVHRQLQRAGESLWVGVGVGNELESDEPCAQPDGNRVPGTAGDQGELCCLGLRQPLSGCPHRPAHYHGAGAHGGSLQAAGGLAAGLPEVETFQAGVGQAIAMAAAGPGCHRTGPWGSQTGGVRARGVGVLSESLRALPPCDGVGRLRVFIEFSCF